MVFKSVDDKDPSILRYIEEWLMDLGGQGCCVLFFGVNPKPRIQASGDDTLVARDSLFWPACVNIQLSFCFIEGRWMENNVAPYQDWHVPGEGMLDSMAGPRLQPITEPESQRRRAARSGFFCSSPQPGSLTQSPTQTGRAVQGSINECLFSFKIHRSSAVVVSERWPSLIRALPDARQINQPQHLKGNSLNSKFLQGPCHRLWHSPREWSGAFCFNRRVYLVFTSPCGEVVRGTALKEQLITVYLTGPLPLDISRLFAVTL